MFSSSASSSQSETASTRASTIQEVSLPWSVDPFDFDNYAEMHVIEPPNKIPIPAESSQASGPKSEGYDGDLSQESFSSSSVSSKKKVCTHKVTNSSQMLSKFTHPFLANSINTQNLSNFSASGYDADNSQNFSESTVNSPKKVSLLNTNNSLLNTTNSLRNTNNFSQFLNQFNATNIPTNLQSQRQPLQDPSHYSQILLHSQDPQDSKKTNPKSEQDSNQQNEDPAEPVNSHSRMSDKFIAKFKSRELYEMFTRHSMIHPKLSHPVHYRILWKDGTYEALYEFSTRQRAGRLETWVWKRITGNLELTGGNWDTLIKSHNWSIEDNYGENDKGEPLNMDFAVEVLKC